MGIANSKKLNSILSMFVLIAFSLFIFTFSFTPLTLAASSKGSKPTLTWWCTLDAKVAVSYNNLSQIAA